MKKNLFFIMLIFIILWGCGYSTRSILPGDKTSIYIENFANKIDVTKEVSDKETYYAYIPAMESDITREIIDRFIFDGNLKIKDAENAKLLLKGELVDFRREPLRYDTNDNVIEYRLRVIVNIELYDLEKDSVIWQEKNFAGESTYRTTGQFAKSEDKAIKETIKDLAQRVVERTVEDW